MNEMVERVAQAIHDEWTGKTIEVRWAALREETRDELRRCARAAIAAMRAPTEAMKAAWTGAAPPNRPELMTRYHAMIDAAFAEPVTKT